MSLDIDWSLLTDDHALAIERFVNDKLGEIELPNYLHNLQVLHFELGKIGPEVSIDDICDPLPEFYEPGEEESKPRAEEVPIDTVPPPDAAASSLRGINPLLARHLEDSELDISIDEYRAGSLRIPRRRSVSIHGRPALGLPSGTTSLSASPEVVRRRRRSSLAAGNEGQALRERRSSMNLSSSGSMALSSSPRRERPRMPPLTQASPQTRPRPERSPETLMHAISLEDLETSSSASGPPPYDHPNHASQQGVSGWEGVNVPYFHSTFAEQSGYVSASGISTPAIHMQEAAQSQTPAPSRRNNRMIFGPGMGHYFNGLGAVPERLASFTTNSRDTASQLGNGKSTLAASDEDVQFHIKLVYKGDMKLVVAVDLALNYPSPFFVTLPLELTLSDLHIESSAAVAYMAERPDSPGGETFRKVHICLLDEAATDQDTATRTSHAEDLGPQKSAIRGFHIESRIGGSGPQEDAVDAIRDVEKVEKLMLKMIRELLEKEIVFPSFYTLVLG